MKYKLCKLYLTVTRFLISLSKVGVVWLGTRVRYYGRIYTVSNSYRWIKGERIYRLSNVAVQFPVDARRNDFKMILDFKNLKHNATFWWRWYKQNWLGFDASAMSKGLTLSSVKALGRKRALGLTKD